MKKVLVFILLLTCGTVWAAGFSPTVLKFDAPKTMQYDFDGKPLELPITVTGKPATVLFFVYTKDQAGKIVGVQNGHLGWHYVNKIDTCVYMSEAVTLPVGKANITWSGKNSDGAMVPSGEYTYYLWGFDSVSPRAIVCKFFGGRQNQAGLIQEYDSNNVALSVPIYYPPAGAIPQIAKENGGYDGTTNPGIKTRSKWILGSDPMDSTLIETTAYMGWNDHGKIAFMPGDHQYFFVENYIVKAVIPGGMQHVMKFKWVPNGLSDQVLDFGEDGMFSIANTSGGYAGPITDNVNSLWLVIGDNSYPDVDNPEAMYYVDTETGSLLRTYDLSWLWWDQREAERGITLNYKYHGGPTMANFKNGRMYCAGLSFCMKHCLDPYQEDDNDVTLWYNGNGDYVGDRFFEPDRGDLAWLCSGGSGAPWVYDYTADMNGFSIFSAYDLGAVSMGLMAPDGTGVGYFAFPGEASAIKYGQLIVDNESAFDGIYCDNAGDPDLMRSLWYVAQDSFKGTLTASSVNVAENAPQAFLVAQNSPNPFNPTTTISFSIPDAGTVSVDVYNVAGQKVATVANEFMSSGSHSVIWDATGFSAGVYFYTVKSGEFAKTMKMTLLK
ncbi:T9SS type A sorting domain-containing protein [bacterium]|nr:T9SS type A sorting domain-containing protein [bacterium]